MDFFWDGNIFFDKKQTKFNLNVVSKKNMYICKLKLSDEKAYYKWRFGKVLQMESVDKAFCGYGTEYYRIP